MNIWLAYVAYPITTAAYIERALRTCCRVTTIGPPLPNVLLDKWHLQNLKLPLKDHDISTGFTPDMAEVLQNTDPESHPELYLWVESVGGHFPQHLDSIGCTKACYFIDTHLNLSWHLEWATHFDLVFIAQQEYLDEFRKAGIRAHWLPVGCDPDIHRSLSTSKSYEIGFAGTVPPNSRRERLLKTLYAHFPVHSERCFWDDMARLFSNSKIVFNEALKNDLNMRVFEAMSTGALLLTDMAHKSGQQVLFRDGEDYAAYHDRNIIDVARFYLENPLLREQIAARGQQLVRNAHTYRHRVDDLLAVALGGKPDTFSAEELRERSLRDVPQIDAACNDAICISTAKRSFVIPVLDMSPASEYNISTLLDDLRDVEGDVIVIFNGREVAEQLKHHPRITRYAVMKQNVGVARAWNLGLEIAATPTVFIMNADLHVESSAVDALERALWELPDAACVGPQGAFSNFTLTRDYVYLDKGTFDRPLEVDAVSGFFFALKLEHFTRKLIRFENGFTPCYFEELDLGLQIKQAGLKSYVIPTTAYDHHWSGTIRALREIRYYEKAETAGEILLRNRLMFLNKWRGITGRESNGHILKSCFFSYAKGQAQLFMETGNFTAANQMLDHLERQCPEDAELAVLRRFMCLQATKVSQTAPSLETRS